MDFWNCHMGDGLLHLTSFLSANKGSCLEGKMQFHQIFNKKREKKKEEEKRKIIRKILINQLINETKQIK